MEENAVEMLVVTERLGWPPRRWWSRWLLVEWQGRLVYEDEPDRPTAMCHLQPAEREAALCGFPWEALVLVPGEPGWTDLHPELRCPDCGRASGVSDEDPSGRSYRHTFPPSR